MISLRVSLLFLLAGPLSACVVPIAEPIYSTCRGTSGGDWKASIERVPRWRGGKPKKPIIVVSGKVNVPDGVDVRLELGPIEKLDQRVQQILVRTEGSAPSDVTLAPQSVHGRFDAAKKVESVRIRCGDGIFATIDSLPEATPPPA